MTVLVGAFELREMLADGDELALVDVREELIYSQSHLLLARSIPLSRLELNFARLVPRRTTRIVLCDENDGLAERAAAILSRSGYSDVRILAGGTAVWAAAGFELFSGVNVPSKAFGEYIEHADGTPSIAADELESLLRANADLVVLDSRPFDEYVRVSIPTATNVPGAELVLRARELAPSPQTTIVVNCAGRTRSIIGAQSLINAGLPNKVIALRNGTMGWSLAGLYLRQRQEPPRSGGVAHDARLGANRGATGGARLRRQTHRSTDARCLASRPHAHALPFRRARSHRIRKTAMCPGQYRLPAASSCRRPTNMSARLGHESCWSTMPRSAPR